jgi:hypothetical protein
VCIIIMIVIIEIAQCLGVFTLNKRSSRRSRNRVEKRIKNEMITISNYYIT